MNKARGFDLLPQTPAIVALREWAEATDFEESQAAAHAYCAAMTEQTGDPTAGVQDLARAIGESLGRAGLPVNTRWRLPDRSIRPELVAGEVS
jgi:hypothetical protein